MPLSVQIITATYRSHTLERALRSVVSQDYPARSIVIDGGSDPVMLQGARAVLRDGDILVSEPDNGIYDALNKGIALAEADVVGILHSDDVFASPSAVRGVLEVMESTGADVAYGDLDYVDGSGRVIRHWRAGRYRRANRHLGWMPPHPTMFVRRSVFTRLGGYDTRYRVSGDYEFILRLMADADLRWAYRPHTITRMQTGGASNRSLRQILVKSREDLRALRLHAPCAWAALVLKNVSKIPQFAHRKRTPA